MSDQFALLKQNVTTGDDMDAWLHMMNSMVNFLSSASILATKLEQNYLLSNVVNVRRPAFPLLTAPVPPKEIVVTNNTNKVVEQVPILLVAADSVYQEPNDLPQEIKLINTEDKGDTTTSDSIEEQEVAPPSDLEETFSDTCEVEETIKICDSEDTIYFDDFVENNKHLQIPARQTKETVEANKIVSKPLTVEKNESICPSTSFVEDKSVQAKNHNDHICKNKNKVKLIKSEEIQTNSTSRYKDTVRALITKSPELQKPIKECLSHNQNKNNVVTTKEVPVCRRNTVPKNLNELKEQLDSINVSSSKIAVEEQKVTPVDKNVLKKNNKHEKQLLNVPNVNSSPNNVPLKSPGTSKRFASIESVVKKLIRTTKVVEKKIEETKNCQKVCTSAQRCLKKKNAQIEENKDNTTEKECPVKDYRLVKNHHDYVYKRTLVQKSDKVKVMNSQGKSVVNQNQAKIATSRSRSQSRSAALKSNKNANSTAEMCKKKEKDLK